MCYLDGRPPPDSSGGRRLPACEDPSKPSDSRPVQLPFPLCFAHRASTWGHRGVCFLALPAAMRTAGLAAEREVYPDGFPTTRRALARMYRITRRQLACVLRGENALSDARVDPEEQLLDRTSTLHQTGVADLSTGPNDGGRPPLYHLCLYLGVNPRFGHEPVYTFTGSPESVDVAINTPSEAYRGKVIAGLLQTYGRIMSDLELAAYLSDALRTGIDPAQRPACDPDFDVLGEIERTRAELGIEAPVGHFAVVERTRDRTGSRREFIAWLRRHPGLTGAAPLGLDAGDLFVTSRTVVDRVHLDLREDGRPRRYLFVPALPDGDGPEAPAPHSRLRVPAVLLGGRPIEPEPDGESGAPGRSPNTAGGATGPPVLRGQPVAAHALALDEKIRVGLGVNVGDVVSFAPELRARPQYARRRAREGGAPAWQGAKRLLARATNVLGGVVERAVRSQPVLMRVDFSTPVDMEINLCRMAREVFDVIGVNPGDHVKVVGARGTRVGLRAIEMTEAQIRRRRVQQDRMPQWFQAHLLRPDLRRVRRMATDSELPVVYLDQAARNRLGIVTGDVVRVVRDPIRNLGFRIYLVVGPVVLIVARSITAGDLLKWETAVAAGLVLAVTLTLIVLELRLRISR